MRLFKPNVEKMKQQRDCAGLIHALEDPDQGIRTAAIDALVAIGPPALDALVGALGHPSPDVRVFASWALIRITDRRVVPALIKALGDPQREVRLNATIALRGYCDPAAVGGLVNRLEDSDDAVAENARLALEKIGGPAVPALIAALSHAGSHVRERAARALAEIADPRALQLLIAAMADENAAVRGSAAYELGRLADPAAFDALFKALDDPNKHVRDAARKALVSIGQPALAPLLALLADGDIKQQMSAISVLDELHWRPDRSEAAAWYWIVKEKWDKCAKIGPPAAEPLFRAAQRSPSVKINALAALAATGDGRALDLLLDILQQDQSETVDWKVPNRGKAALALGQLGDRRAVGALVAALKDRTPSVRSAAAEALCLLGWQPADDDAALLYLEATSYEKPIGPLGEKAVKALWAMLEAAIAARNSYPLKKLLNLLEQSDDPGKRGRFIGLMFSHLENIARLGLAVPPWFGKYTAKLQTVVNTFIPTQKGEMSWRDNDGYDITFQYDTRPLQQVLDALCRLDNPLTSNLLREIASLPEIQVIDGATDRGDAGYEPHELAEIGKMRRQAKIELMHRGNPPHDPAAYEVDEYFN